MATVTETTTIRVTKKTRDRLAAVAESRDISVTDLVKELARDAWREYAYASEREARRLDALNPEAVAEYELYDEAASDGID